MYKFDIVLQIADFHCAQCEKEFDCGLSLQCEKELKTKSIKAVKILPTIVCAKCVWFTYLFRFPLFREK